MAVSSKSKAPDRRRASTPKRRPTPPASSPNIELVRWGGAAGLGGAALLVGAFAVVIGMDLPDASEVETLTDFADIESGRIAEHFFYLGALMLFALHVFVLHRLLRPAHQAAALFGTVVASFGFVMMAASSLLHVSTAPLADLYTAPGNSPEELRAIEYAWHGAQSVFDTMLATGVLLVPIGIVLLGVAMLRAPVFGLGLSAFSIVLGIAGTVGAAVAVIEPGSMFSALSVLAIAVFSGSSGWRVLRLASGDPIDLTDTRRP